MGSNVDSIFIVCYAGVIARHPGYLPYLRAALTPEVVADYFSHLIDDNTPVERYIDTSKICLSHIVMCVYFRYELAGIRAFNFVLKNSLGGGGVSSIRLDPQVSQPIIMPQLQALL